MNASATTRRVALRLTAGGALLAAACGGPGGSSTPAERSPIEGLKAAGTISWSF